MDRSSTTVMLVAALLLPSCSSHEKSQQTGKEALSEECPGARANAWLLKKIQGTWSVRYADYEFGQKPPTGKPIGTLEFDVCSYRFKSLPMPELKSRKSLAELALARRELPFINTPQGTIELDKIIGMWRYTGQPLGRLTLVSDAPEPTRWVIDVSERRQEGEYLSMVPAKAEFHRWTIERGKWRRRPGEYIPGSDPELPVNPH